MENIIVTINFRRQLNQVILHEQVENGTTIHRNLSVGQEDQQFVTFIKVFQTKQRHP
jgi:hypothetical protein